MTYLFSTALMTLLPAKRSRPLPHSGGDHLAILCVNCSPLTRQKSCFVHIKIRAPVADFSG